MNPIIAFALRQRVLAVLMFVALLCAGLVAFLALNIEA